MSSQRSSSIPVELVLSLADNALILGHRNSEWCGHGPVLEQDIAITNISLDLIGQARNFYQYAAQLLNDGNTEDSLAYLRDSSQFRNVVLAELPRGDWAFTITRQFFFSQFQYLQYEMLANLKDEQIAAIAVKSLKELTYHVRWSSEWVIRLGDGTETSAQKIRTAVDEIWPYTAELFSSTPYELEASAKGYGIDPSTLNQAWLEKIQIIFSEAGISMPVASSNDTAGKTGNHTHHLEQLLGEMQYLQRTYPGCEW